MQLVVKKLIGSTREIAVRHCAVLLIAQLCITRLYAVESESLYIELPEQEAEISLNALADRFDHSLLYSRPDLKDIILKPVRGDFTLPVALDILLKDISLNAVVTKKRVIVVSLTPVNKQHDEGKGMLNKKTKKSLFGGIAALFASAVATSNVTAQDSDREDYTEEIVVVGKYSLFDRDTTGATRLPIPLNEVPQAVSLINEDFIDLADMRALSDVVNYAPGVMSNGPVWDLGVLKFRGFTESPEETYKLNGRKYHRLTEFDLAAFERIEVVRGPSSVIYGLGTPGGTINLQFRNPTDEPQGAAYVSYGSRDNVRVDAYYGGAISDSVRVLGGVAYEDGDSHVDVVNHNHLMGYMAVEVDLTDRLRLEVDAITQKKSGDVSDGIPLLPDGSTPDVSRSLYLGHPNANRFEMDGYILSSVLTFDVTENLEIGVNANIQEIDGDRTMFFPFGPADANGDTTISGFGNIPHAETEYYEIFSTFKFDVFGQDNNLVNITAFDSSIIVDGPFLPLPSTQFENGTPFSSVNMFDDSQSDILGIIGRGTNNRGAAIANIENVFKNHGVSAQLVLKPHDRLILNFGGTYIKAKQGDPDRGGVLEVDDTAFRVGAVFEVFQGINVYSSYSESFIPQTNLDINNQPLPPLSGTQIEAGIKASFLNESLLLSASVFSIKQSNVAQVVPFTVPERYEAVGEVRHKGFELEAVGSPISGLTLSANYSYLDTERTKDNDPALEGEKRLFVPKHNAAVFLNYELLSGPLAGVGLGGGIRHVGSQRILFDPAIKRLPSYTVMDLVGFYTWNDYEFRLNVKNLLDRDYWSSTYDNFFFGFWHEAGRNVSLTIGKKF